MGKMKVHELAKELNVPSKDLVEKLNKMGYSVKSHLSTLEDKEVDEIKSKLNNKSKDDDKKSQVKKEKKPIAPVIIRREVTRVESTETNKETVNKGDRSDLGVVQRRTDTSMNIKYRTEPRKVNNIATNRKEVVKPQEAKPEKIIDTNKTSNVTENKTEDTKVAAAESNKEEKKINTQVTKAEDTNMPKIENKTEIKKEEVKTDVKETVKTETNNTNINNDATKNNNEINSQSKVADNKSQVNKNDGQNTKLNNNDKQFNKDNRNSDRPFNREGQNNRDGQYNRDNRNGNRPFNRDGQNRDGQYNRDNRNGDRPFNRDGQNRDGQFNRDNRNGNRPFNKDGQHRDGQFNRDNRNGDRPYNRDGQNNRDGQYNRDNRNGNRQQRQPENKVEKGIKEIMSATVAADMPSKEAARENVRTEYKDKQKVNRKFEEENVTKKSSKSKASRAEMDDINYDKLKDLQTESNFSDMFNDTESKMFDYYDLSKSKHKNTNKKKNNKKPTESKNHIEQKIFDLTDIEIPETISVKDLAEKLKKQASEVIKKLMGFGLLATLNQELDYDTAYLVASEFGVTAHKKEVVSDEDILFDESEDKEEDLMPRPPIVVVMGHVDHGKTSLLDAIRSTNVIEREAGGITQHIGAYKVKVNDREICFLDTPGHEAFTAMRARGAQVTDIAIIIVAANDGIMPQTVEAINHAKAAGVSIVVAINKIDLPGANVEKVKQELTEYGLVPEEWGGDTICVPISAKQRQNIDGLLEILLLVADMKELKSNPNKQAKGTVIEARLDKNTGITASLLVQRGTLNIGDTIVVGSVIGKIRAMKDDRGQKVKAAGPSTPVEIVGLPEVPVAGEVFYEVENEKVAKHLIEKRKRKEREEMIQKSAPVTLDNLFNQIEQGKLKDLNIIVKADVQGSVQAIRQSLEKIQNEEARVRIIHANVGAITESDVTLAKVTNSIIIGFNVRPEPMAKSTADKENVEIKIYSVIYSAIDDVEAALKGMLKPKYKEIIQGTAEVRQVFKITNVGMIAGCYVIDGKIVRNSGVRVLRDNVVVHEGKLVSLKREKDDAKEVATGYECGVQVEDYNDIKVGDHIESFIMEEIKR
ncbi:MAG: translation initiation factor IF-2 [Clostridia bacterium]|nr:translation initiation factor IF-2 [Clostridia bacterium]